MTTLEKDHVRIKSLRSCDVDWLLAIECGWHPDRHGIFQLRREAHFPLRRSFNDRYGLLSPSKQGWFIISKSYKDIDIPGVDPRMAWSPSHDSGLLFDLYRHFDTCKGISEHHFFKDKDLKKNLLNDTLSSLAVDLLTCLTSSTVHKHKLADPNFDYSTYDCHAPPGD